MIGIIDYGLGNIHAIVNIYKKLNLDAMPVKIQMNYAPQKN